LNEHFYITWSATDTTGNGFRRERKIKKNATARKNSEQCTNGTFAFTCQSTKPARRKIQKNAIATALLFLLTFSNSFSQTFRRHFIIAYDISTPSINSVNNCPAFQQALKDLFSNKSVYRYNEAYQDNINLERKNGLAFFDPKHDEISFFHFNIASSEFDRLMWTANNYDEKGIVAEFSKLFLKDKKLNWTNLYGKEGITASPSNYITSALSIRPTPANFNGGVSMSNFVYPLVLDKIETTKYAEEYVLILLSDFLTGSMLGNTKDLDRVRDIYRVPYGRGLQPSSAVTYIKKKIDFLASQYYKIDFFQYSFIPTNTSSPIGIIAYKIKPKIGVLTPEDVSLFVDGDLSLDQRGFQSQDFKTSETKIKFTHNKNLAPTELRMTVTLPIGRGNMIIFDDLIARKDETGKWISKYTTDKDLMNFDSSNLTYYLPNLNISLNSIINKKNFGNITFTYEFKSKYIVANTQPLNFIYKTEKALPIENIDYSTKATIIIMTIILPILIVILLLIFLMVYGKPRRLFFPPLDGYLDSFEKTDYKTDGKLLTPFKAWNYELQNGVDLLLVNGAVEYKSPNFPLNWNSSVYLQLTVEKIPTGFEMFLKHDLKDYKEFGAGTPTTIKKGKNNKLEFAVGLRQTDVTKTIVDPELVKFSVEVVIKDSILFIKSEHRDIVEYKFHLGADLLDVWVGFDPGTSGSCVAVGSSTDNIILGEDMKILDQTSPARRIIPSVLVFDKQEAFQQNGADVPDKIFKYGNEAQSRFNNKKQFQGFQSIKKLLGFKDVKEIVFDNKNTLSLKGKDLAGLLVKGLFKDINTFFNRPDINADDYKRDGKFNPLRAVVAIPNNFTTSKIQDMVDCIGKINQFKEIRYVYEAEAVLFYYLSNYSQFSGGEAATNSETILVFDMGGATINATIVTANKTLINGRPKYEIDFLGKIGYGIGGDTIDYCITKFILSFKTEYPELASVDIFDKKSELSSMALKIKVAMIENFYKGHDYLITYSQLEDYINELGVAITIEEETSGMYKYFLKKSGKFKLFEDTLFIKTIYNNVKDAVNEVVELSDSTHIDKIIFSGRSTSFPMIKETVEKQLNAKKSETKSIALNLEDSKMAVAKGACWYGINKNSVRLNNLKTNAAFGFKKTQSADKSDVKFYELVEMGCNFDTSNDGIDSFQGVEEIKDDFAFDGSKVNFYQVMGKDADKILSEGQKHKFSKIATINLDQATSKVAMKVNENDEVECAVILHTNRQLKEKGVVSDQEIDEANEEHYTWIVK
jgi:molecular chaperone DnaK (HSP70)